MADCIILIGLPASGKSSFYREHFAGSHDHVSKDMLSHSRHKDRRQEKLVSASLSRGRSLVIDNTNPSVSIRAPLIALAKTYGARVIGYFFLSEAGDALRRNRARQGTERVPDVAIFAARKRLEPPTFTEGFDRLFSVRLDEAQRRFDVVPVEKTP